MKKLILLSVFLVCFIMMHSQDLTEVQIDCSKFKKGLFSFEAGKRTNTLVRRCAKKQIEYSKKNKSKITSKIEWVGDCEFVLTCIKVNKVENKKYIGTKLRVKIVDVYESSYKYESTFENGAKQLERHHKLK